MTRRWRWRWRIGWLPRDHQGRRRWWRTRHARRSQRRLTAIRTQTGAGRSGNAFKDSTVYIEKYIELARHVEVQILADHHGNTVHLWERDCSMQRRHQKLVEESPCPVLKPENRQKLCDAAVRLIKAAGYTNAGTVEFLVDRKQNFFLLEVNARIQVEHPVTEQVTELI